MGTWHTLTRYQYEQLIADLLRTQDGLPLLTAEWGAGQLLQHS